MLRVATDVVFGSGRRRRDGPSRRLALAWIAAGFWSVGEIVGVVLTGVVRVWIGFEASVYDGGGRVDVHFTHTQSAAA